MVRKHFDKTPDSPGDELLAAAVFRGVPNDGRSASKTLHLQVHSEDHDEDQSSLDSSSMKSASSRHTGTTGISHRSARSLQTREDLKLQALRSRIAALEAEDRSLGMTKPNVARHCQVIAKLAAKKSELEKLLQRRSSDLDVETDEFRPSILAIEEDIETDTNAPVQTK